MKLTDPSAGYELKFPRSVEKNFVGPVAACAAGGVVSSSLSEDAEVGVLHAENAQSARMQPLSRIMCPLRRVMG